MAQHGANSNTVHLRVVEPEILDVEKTVQTTNADGTEATYQITFSNSGNASAFDLRILDSMPAELSLQTLSVSVSATGTVVGVDNSKQHPQRFGRTNRRDGSRCKCDDHLCG